MNEVILMSKAMELVLINSRKNFVIGLLTGNKRLKRYQSLPRAMELKEKSMK